MRSVARLLGWGATMLQTGTLQRTLGRVVPTALAIVPVSALFGALAARADWSLLEILAVGALGFSGSGQFALLPLAEADAGFFTMLLVTASINSRYVPIAYASAGGAPASPPPRAAHMLGDEAYATEHESDSRRTVILIRGTIFGAWVGAGLLGAVLGQFIPAAWIGEEVNLGFPASVVLMYLSGSQLRARLWLVRDDGNGRPGLLAAAGLCAGVSLLLINLVGPLYFWIPSVLAATVILGRTKI